MSRSGSGCGSGSMSRSGSGCGSGSMSRCGSGCGSGGGSRSGSGCGSGGGSRSGSGYGSGRGSGSSYCGGCGSGSDGWSQARARMCEEWWGRLVGRSVGRSRGAAWIRLRVGHAGTGEAGTETARGAGEAGGTRTKASREVGETVATEIHRSSGVLWLNSQSRGTTTSKLKRSGVGTGLGTTGGANGEKTKLVAERARLV